MTGSLQIRNGRYQMVLELGEGKQKWISTRLSVSRNKRKAEKMLQDAIRAYEEKVAQKALQDSAPEMMATDLIKEYLAAKKGSIRANSYTSYMETATLHLIPYFEELGVTVRQIGAAHVQRYYNAKSSQGLSPETLTRHRTIIRGALDYAVQTLDIISINVADKVKLPRKATKRTPTYYNEKQLKDLFRVVEGESIEAPVKLSTTYGLRRGETIGLKWDAIDWRKKTIRIQHSVVRNGKEIICDDTVKETASFRTMPFTKDIEVFLKQLRDHQRKMEKLYGNGYQNKDNYICVWDDGKRLDPDYVTSRFGRFLKKRNLPHIRFHDLRHSSATILICNGFTLEQVRDWLGHASIRSTERYAHYQSDSKKDLAYAVGELLSLAE